MDQTRPISPRPRDYNRRDDNNRNNSNNVNNTSSKSSSSSTRNVPSNEQWTAESRKRPQVPLSSGSVRYAGHKDIKLTLNKVRHKSPKPISSLRS